MTEKIEDRENKLKILIVEDSKTQALKLQYLLESHDFAARWANNGRQALLMINEQLPDLILTDIVMPGMNGYELCREIKANEITQNIPVILLTSRTNPEDILEGLNCGADNFITKPFSEEYLLGHIGQIIANQTLFKVERVRVCVGINFGGKKHFVSVDQQQMLSQLLSSYEAAARRNTELIKAREDLRALQDHLEDLVDERTMDLQAQLDLAVNCLNTAQAAILKLDMQGKIVYFNQYCAEILACGLEEVRGQDWFSSFILESDRVKAIELFAQALIGRNNCGNVNTVLSRNGSMIEVKWFDNTLKGRNGETTGLLATGQIIMRGS